MIIYIYHLLLFVSFNKCTAQSGPDPWNYDDVSSTSIVPNEPELPPDLKMPLKRISTFETKSNGGIGEWSYKRTLAILLKGGQIKRHDDGTIDVSVQMKFYPEQWDILDSYLKSDTAFTEEMFRRSLGFIQEAIYKPSIMENIVLTWSDYVQDFFINYKMHVTWTLLVLSIISAMVWFWNHRSHLIIVLFGMLYLYEVFVSYKEVEQKELDTFLNALQTCKWYFWRSSCEVPTPDLLIFLKHMNPMKIAIRMLTTFMTEPLVIVSDTVKTINHGITDGLWFPFDKIVYGTLNIFIHLLLIFFFIMVIFNYILNIPFNLSVLGLLSIGVKQRRRTLFSQNKTEETLPREENVDRIRGATLDKILDVCSRALDNASQNRSRRVEDLPNNFPILKRSSSTGRLPNKNVSSESLNRFAIDYNVSQKCNVTLKHRGGGDAM